ncbi:MAG: LacI family DNA-binding transcriptional regulator [Marinifilaceae bacterium]|jgi:LacI family transcriptional regulator
MAQITIKDIARELGISPSTVSRALKDHPDINVTTKKKVVEFAKKHHYTPNAIALSLKSQKTHTIGVIIPEIVHHFFSCVISGIEDIAAKAGFNVMIFQSNESHEREVSICDTLIANHVDGVLVSMSKNTFNYDHFKKLKGSGASIVFFDRICKEVDTDRVIINDYKSAFTAVEHLIEIGCKRIAHLSASQQLIIGQQRRMGYTEALKKHKLKIDEDIIIKCDNNVEAFEIVSDLMKLPNPPDGIFAVNDLTAAGALSAVKRAGYEVPEDIAIVGFTDGLVSTVTDPTLTTVEQHGFEMGQTAMEMLLKRINSKDDYETITKVIKTNLVLRESSNR